MAKPRTAKQKAALRKAQLASARKRRKSGGKSKSAPKKRGRSNGQKVALVAYTAAVGYMTYRSARNIHSEIKKGQAQRSAIRRAGARERVNSRKAQRRLYNFMVAEDHLRNIKYGRSRRVVSERVFPLQTKALPRGKRGSWG